ncbi:MAG: hypothetical protein HY011_09030 [Acidobacteria bacterium]|nr:hypothetical protein [Acidobacteriota bacterium]
MMKKTKPNPSSEKQNDSNKQAELTEEEGFQRLELEELNQPPKLVPNEGVRGAELSQKVEQFRQQLQGRYDTAMAQGARRLVSQTVKETVVDDIVRRGASGQSRSQLEQLPIGELHKFLPRFDWRIKAVVPAVRDQEKCGSCWAHTATAVLESNLRIQLANFATNNMDSRPDTFFVSWVDLNVHSTLHCVAPRNCNGGGRYETAFNYYFKRGIPHSEVSLNGTPLDQPAPAQPVAKIPERDRPLPKGHCQNQTTDRIKIVGWDYVNQAKPFAIPPVEDLKSALLEHGPLAVGINTKGLEEYGDLRLLEQSEELGRNADTGISFKREQISGGLLVCIPAKLVRKQAVPSLNGEFFNLNLPKGGDRRYQFLPEAAAIFTQGTHLRAAQKDLDVAEFNHINTDVFGGPGKDSIRETETFILHFPASNAVNLEQDSATSKFALRLPQNTDAKMRLNARGELTLVIPWQPPENLTPVFEARADLPFNHYVLVVGWDDRKQAWIMQNSWGEAWGFPCGFSSDSAGKTVNGGYAYVRYGTFGQFAAWVEAPLIEQRLAERLKRVPAR